MKKFFVMIAILVAVSAVKRITYVMINDNNSLIRFLGFALAIVTVVFTLWLVLVIFFEYNFLNGLF